MLHAPSTVEIKTNWLPQHETKSYPSVCLLVLNGNKKIRVILVGKSLEKINSQLVILVLF